MLLTPLIRAQQSSTVRFGKLWDGSQIITDAVVVIEGDRILSVGSGSTSVPKGATVIDLRKYTAIPGLIDLHTHITYYWDRKPGTRPRGVQRLPAVTVYLAQDNARRTLETGVTTVRDLNAGSDMDLAMRELIASGAMIGPRMFVSGPGLSSRPNQPHRVPLPPQKSPVAVATPMAMFRAPIRWCRSTASTWRRAASAAWSTRTARLAR